MKIICAHLLTDVDTPLVYVNALDSLYHFVSFKRNSSKCKWHSKTIFIHKNLVSRQKMKLHSVCEHLCDRERFRNDFCHFKYSFCIFVGLDEFNLFIFCEWCFRAWTKRDSRVNLIPSRRDLGRKWHVYKSSIIKRTNRDSLTIHF